MATNPPTTMSPESIAALESGYQYQSRRADALHEELGLVAWLEKQRYWQMLPQAEELMHEWALGNVSVEKLREIKQAVTVAVSSAVTKEGA